jgi:hypothetical protein
MKRIFYAILMGFPLLAVGDPPTSTKSTTDTSTAPAPRVPTVRSSVSATVREALPGAQPRQGLPADFPLPGKLTVSATQFCGDGDVANFANTHPGWDHQEGGNVNVVFGYWVVGDGDVYYPVPDDYFAIGSTSIAIGGAATTKMTPATGGTQVETLAAINTMMGMMSQLPGYALSASPTPKDQFRVFLAAMMCKSVTTPDVPKHDPIKVTVEFGDLKDQLQAAFHNAIGSASSWSNVKDAVTVKISDNGDTIRAKVGSGHSVKLDGSDPSDWAQKAFELPKPSGTDLATYVNALKNVSFLGDVKSFAAEFEAKATCAEISRIDNAKRYPWEPYPLQLTCAAYNYGFLSGQAGSLRARLEALTNPATLPSDAEFKRLKFALAEALAAGSLMQTAQIAFRDRADPLPKQRCFTDPTSNYIDKVMASVVFRATPGSPEYVMSHPEGAFAVAEYVNYYGNNDYTVFHMTSPPADHDYGRLITRGASPATNAIYVPDKVVMRLNVRGVGCGTNVYCWNDRR